MLQSLEIMKLTALTIALVSILCFSETHANIESSTNSLNIRQSSIQQGSLTSTKGNNWRYHNWKNMSRKDRRLQLGEDVMLLSVQLLQPSGYMGVLVLVPIVAIGGGIML